MAGAGWLGRAARAGAGAAAGGLAAGAAVGLGAGGLEGAGSGGGGGGLGGSVARAPALLARLGRDLLAVGRISLDYRASLRGLEPGSPEREEAKHACHARSALILRDLCFSNGGIYTKLGQHLGQLDYLLPAEYVHTMRESLLHRCPVTPLGDVRRTVEEDLGRPLEEVFKRFEEAPVASASLAQVHEAETLSGQRVAVKVQHQGLREAASADIATVSALVAGVRVFFPNFDYGWLVAEIRRNLPKELDFRVEAENTERCQKNIAGSRLGTSVEVPAVHAELSGPRVLTMDFAEGVPVGDRAAIEAAGLYPAEVARLVARTFSDMIFEHGFVHCDPHEANMLVRRVGGRPRLILLDHGLYREIDDAFRLEYAALWRSLIFGDAPGIKRHSESMNAGDLYPLFAAMLTMRPWDSIVKSQEGAGGIDRLRLEGSAREKQNLQVYAMEYFQGISTLLGRIPSEMLLLLKTNDCLRAVDSALGAPVNTFIITARSTSRVLAVERGPRLPWVAAGLARLFQKVNLELRLLAMQVCALLY